MRNGLKIAGVFTLSILSAVALSADEAGVQVADLDAGAKVFRKCASCHKVGEGAKNRLGPVLNGVFGSQAGIADQFPYSKAMVEAGVAGLIWNEDTLDAYIENPKKFLTGTRMIFRGVKDPQDRRNVLAYLRQFSQETTAAGSAEVDLPEDILAIIGDPEYGEYLAGDCQTCHQSDGANEGIPAITNWATRDFVTAMHAYKLKLRPHPVMQMMAARLSDEEIAALAAYFKDLE